MTKNFSNYQIYTDISAARNIFVNLDSIADSVLSKHISRRTLLNQIANNIILCLGTVYTGKLNGILEGLPYFHVSEISYSINCNI